VAIYTECLRHLKAAVDTCNHMLAKVEQTAKDHEMFVSSLRKQL